MPKNTSEKKRFSRGRRPGVPIDQYEKTEKTNARPHLARFSVSLPIELGRMVRALAPQLDMEYSKIFRAGLDSVVEQALHQGKIDMEFYQRYKAARRAFRDEDWSGPE
jgi:hypothetical protein